MDSKEKAKYRASKAFRLIRQAVLEDRDWTCEICAIRKKKGLHVHHLDERTYGRERPEDLVVLCSSCHKHIIERFLRRKSIDIDQTAENLIRVYTSSVKMANSKVYFLDAE